MVLNACETEDIGKGHRIRCEFLHSLGSVRRENARTGSGGGAARAPMKHLAAGAVDYVCLLSQDGDEFPDTGYNRGKGDDEESSRVSRRRVSRRSCLNKLVTLEEGKIKELTAGLASLALP